MGSFNSMAANTLEQKTPPPSAFNRSLKALVRHSRLARRIVLPFLLKRTFARFFPYPLNLDDPQSFAQKIQWLKVFGRLSRFAPYVDKFEVREYVRKTIGDEHLVPLLGVYDSVDQIPWDRLPPRFVIKAAHGCGWNVIVRDASTLDREATAQKLDQWLHQNYFDRTYEEQYLVIRKRLIVEKMLGQGVEVPWDYKFFCFQGEPTLISIDLGRFENNTRKLLSPDWTPVEGTIKFPAPPGEFHRPPELEQMLAIARKLSRPFHFVRVDLYLVEGLIYFGELTFTPESGLAFVTPPSFDFWRGSQLDLTKFRDTAVPAFYEESVGDDTASLRRGDPLRR
jgi:hypothetical protein